MHFQPISRLGLALLLFLCIPLGLLAQVSVRGRVLDDNKTPLAFANVRLTNAAGKLQGGQASDKQGNYRISGVPAGTYTLEISFVGYKNHRWQITVGKSDLKLKDIALAEDGQLKEVQVIGKATEVVVKGDTIEYNAGSYTTAEGAELLELIKKLPGAQVDENGNVTVNGKSITQIMVDGKRFFESDPKVALKNLPAELVDKVQVLDKQSDNARMTGFADGDDETVINLTIKPGRKQGLFGTAFAGAGTKERYEASAMLNRFTDGKQWSILGSLNNTNNAGFSDIASDISRSDIAQMASGSGRRPWQRNNSSDGITISRMLGANLILSIDSKTQAGGSAFVGNSKRGVQTKSETTNIQTAGNTVDKGETSEDNDKWNVGTNLRLEWKPNSRTEFILSPRLSYGTGKGLYLSSSSSAHELSGATISTSSLTQTTDNKVYDGRVQLDMSHKLSDKGRTVALSLEGRLSGNDLSGQYLSDTYVASSASTTHIDQQLSNEERGREFRLRANYVEPLSQRLALQLNYQLRGQFSNTTRTLYDLNAATGLYDSYNASNSYELRSDFYAHRAGLALKYATKTSDLTAGLNVDPSQLITTRLLHTGETVIKRNVVNFSPTLRYTYKPSRAFNLRLDYRGQSFQPTVNQLSPISDSTNPLVVYVGNENLLPGFRHNVMANMSIFSAAKQSSLNLFAFANLTENNIVSKSLYDTTTGVRTYSYENVNGNWSASLGGFYTTPLPGKKFSLRIGTRNGLSTTVGFSNGERNKARTHSLSEELTLAYRHGIVDTSLKGVWSHNKVSNSLSSLQASATNDYGIHWDTNLTLPLNLSFESQVRYTTTSGYASGYNFEQTLVNLSLSYSFLQNKAATIRLKVYDLLAEQRNVFRNVSALAISSQETNILGRYAMLHFIYKFSSFGGGATSADMRQTGRRGPGGPPPGAF